MNNQTNMPQDYPRIPGETARDMFLDLGIEKSWWRSRTIWGGLVASAASVATALGYTLDVPLTTDIITGLAGLAGGVVAIFGRVNASTAIAVKVRKIK